MSERLNFAGFVAPDGTPTLVGQLGNPKAKDETLEANEIGYRTSIGQKMSIDVAA